MLGIRRDLVLRSDGGRIRPRFDDGGVDAERRQLVAVRLGEPLQGELRRAVQAEERQRHTPADGPICSGNPLPCLRMWAGPRGSPASTPKTLVSNSCRTCSGVYASRGPETRYRHYSPRHRDDHSL